MQHRSARLLRATLTALLVQAALAGAAASQEQTLVPRGSERPSFNCAKAKTAAARLICADGELARLDGELGVAFQKRKAQISAADQSKFIAAHVAWIRDRNTHCELDGKNSAAIEVLAGAKPCMVSEIRKRFTALAQTRPAMTTAAVGAAETFEDLWAQTKEECLDEEGPNSRTLIDLSNVVRGKPAPL